MLPSGFRAEWFAEGVQKVIRRWLARFVRGLVPAAVLGALVVAQAPVPAAAEFEEASLAGSAAENATSPAGWEVMEPPAELMEGGCPGLVGVWGTSPSDVFAISGIGTLFHYDGSEWSLMDAGPLVSDSGYTELGAGMRGIWGSSASDIYAVGDYSWHQAFVFHWDGSTWTRPVAEYGDCSSISHVWSSSASDVFAVAYEGCTESCRIHHYDGVSWDVYHATDNTHPLYGTRVCGIWGTSSSDVFAVGSGWSNGGGAVLHYDGSGWSRAYTDPTAGLNGIWGSSSSDVFAVGGGGTILHYDGTAWSPMDSSTAIFLSDVWGSSSSSVFAVGYDGGAGSSIMLHYDGSVWSPMATGTTSLLWDIWGTSSDIFAVGAGGTILHYAGNRRPDQPGNAVPSNGAAGVSLTPTLRFSAFRDPDEGDIHAASQWQITTTVDNCTRPVFDSGVDTSNLTQIAVTSETLGYSSEYCWRVRHQDSRGAWSAWSVRTPFTTCAPPPVWGWQNPLPQGNDLRGIWGSSATDVYAVGDRGTIVRYDGNAWNVVPSGVTDNLAGVWGSSSSDVFAVGSGGTILQYSGTVWKAMNSGSSKDLSGVWGSSSSDVFAVGDNGTILHYDGTSWVRMASGTADDLSGVWGSSSSDVFAVGGRLNYSYRQAGHGTVLHYDGSQWSPLPSGTATALVGVFGASSSEVFAVGYSVDDDMINFCFYRSAILGYDGASWSTVDSGGDFFDGIWCSSATDIYAVGGDIKGWAPTVGRIRHFDGSTWTTIRTDHELRGVWGSSPSNIYAVGDYGTILHYDGSAWNTVSSGNTQTLYGVWGTSASDVFAVGGGWNYYPYDSESYGVILHYDGTEWTPMISGTREWLMSVWGSSPSDVFAVGGIGGEGNYTRAILHYDGTSWTEMPSGVSGDEWGCFEDVWGSSATDVFVVCGGMFEGGILHYDGTAWSPMTIEATSPLRGLWGSSSSDVFAVGDHGTVLHYDGSAWSQMDIGTTMADVRGIWGTSATDVFAVGWQYGYGDAVWHYDGTSWSMVSTDSGIRLTDVWGSSSSDVYATGGGGILHYDGITWSPMTTNNERWLGSVWGISSSDIFAVGDGGMILHSAGAVAPAATTSEAVNVTCSRAELRGNMASPGTAPSVRVSFEWGLTTDYGNTTTPQLMNEAGPFSALISGLAPNTTYHYRAVAAGDGTAYGDDMTFTTLVGVSPIVSTAPAADITWSGATLNGEVPSLGERQFVSAAAGGSHGLGLLSDGTLWAWGDNAFGQLGLGDTTDRTSPVRVGTAAGWAAVSAGEYYSLGLRSDGTLWAWGANWHGQLGLGDTAGRTSPVQVGSADDWVVASAEGGHTLGLRSDGTLWAWGANDFGQLGSGDKTDRTNPVQVGSATDWVAASAGGDHSLALRSDGTLWAWGANGFGQLGLGDKTDRTDPVQVDSATDWVAASAGGDHSLALRSDGTLWAWGANSFGQLGVKSADGTVPTRVGTAANWVAILATRACESMGVRSDGTLWAWGNNSFCQLGLGDTLRERYWTPTRVGGATNWTMATGGGGWFLCLRSDGTLWAWGDNGTPGRVVLSPRLSQVSFEWGLSADYGNSTVPQTMTAAGVFSALISGLAPNTTYHYRAVAAGDGTAYGDDMTFTAELVPGGNCPLAVAVAARTGDSGDKETTPAATASADTAGVPDASPSGGPTAGARLWLYPVALVGGFLALSAAASFGAWLRGRLLS